MRAVSLFTDCIRVPNHLIFKRLRRTAAGPIVAASRSHDASPVAKVAISKCSPAHQRQLDARGNQFLLCAFSLTPFSHQVITFSNRDGECPMRNFLACCIAAAVLAVAPVGSRPAEAMPVSTPQAIGAGQVQSNLEQAAYVCRRVWRCGSWGCGWRRTCYWKPRPHRRCVWTQWGRRCW